MITCKWYRMKDDMPLCKNKRTEVNYCSDMTEECDYYRPKKKRKRRG